MTRVLASIIAIVMSSGIPAGVGSTAGYGYGTQASLNGTGSDPQPAAAASSAPVTAAV